MEFHFRSAVLLTFFVFWAAIAAGTLYRRTVAESEKLAERSETFARKEGVLPAARGRILDSEGIPLAWTELHFSLYLHKTPHGVGSDLKRFLQIRFNVKEIPEFAPEQEVILLLDDMPVTSENDLTDLLAVPEKYPQLEVRTRHKRIRVDYPQLSALLGECEDDENGIPHGVSGWEKEYEKQLCGKAGTFSVLLDRNGKWMPGTVKMLTMPVAGQDVVLSVTLEELLRKEGL